MNIVDLYHGAGEGERAMAAFDAQFKKGEEPEDMPEFPLSVVETNDEGKVYQMCIRDSIFSIWMAM